MITKEDLETPGKPTWCPGCGDFGIWLSLKNAIMQLDCKHEDLVVVYGIGCSGNMCSYLHAYGFEGLHGRGIPVAEAIKLANPKLKVIVVAGDGDTYGEGMNHFLTGVRGNHDVTLIVHDNRVYGLTTGQASPTSDHGYKSKSTPAGTIEVPVNPLALAISQGGTFVSRGFSADPQQPTALIVRAVQHRGFALVDVLQNCATFNKVNTVTWFKEHTYRLEEKGYAPSDRFAALKLSMDEERLATGVLYEEQRQSYDEAANDGGIVDADITKVDVTKTMESFM